MPPTYIIADAWVFVTQMIKIYCKKSLKINVKQSELDNINNTRNRLHFRDWETYIWKNTRLWQINNTKLSAELLKYPSLHRSSSIMCYSFYAMILSANYSSRVFNVNLICYDSNVKSFEFSSRRTRHTDLKMDDTARYFYIYCIL